MADGRSTFTHGVPWKSACLSPSRSTYGDEDWYSTVTRDAVDTPDRTISTESEVDSALQKLLHSALENGLDLRGGWEFRHGHADPDLEVLVTELAKQS